MDQLSKISDKLDKITEDVGEIKVDLTEIRKDLNYHILRTDLLQDAVLPIQQHVSFVNNGIKLVVAIAAIAAFLKQMGTNENTRQNNTIQALT